MEELRKDFAESGFIVVADALPIDACELIVRRMFDLNVRGKLSVDSQCPLSLSAYNDFTFVGVLEKLRPFISNATGKKLLPSYAYARIYRTGERLLPHVDRPACEISVTITLGYRANDVWPISFRKDKNISIPINVGSMIVYKGCEVTHWRDVFQGEWHVQLFLHYVDADGPHKDHAYDLLGKGGK